MPGRRAPPAPPSARSAAARPARACGFLGTAGGRGSPNSLIRVRAIRRVLDLARPLSDVVWDMETDGKIADTPERRASLQRAVEQRVAEIADPVVRLPDRDAQPVEPLQASRKTGLGRFGPRRPFRQYKPRLAAGSAHPRRSGSDLEGSRQERALLGGRPTSLDVLAEDLAALPIRQSGAGRACAARVDALSLAPSGTRPAAEEALADGIFRRAVP